MVISTPGARRPPPAEKPSPASPLPPPASGPKPPRQEELERAVRVPVRDPHFFPSPHLDRLLQAALLRAYREHAVNLLLEGDPGTGKTSVPVQFAARAGLRCFVFDCGSVRQLTDWWGRRELEDGRTVFHPSALVHALALGGAVVVLDEINRTPPEYLNTLLPLLDWRRETFLEALGVHVQVGRGTLIVGTANLGEGFTGTYQLDPALLDRLPTRVPLSPPSEPELKQILIQKTGCSPVQAGHLARVARLLNERMPAPDEPLSSPRIGFRHLLSAAHWLAVGASLRDALEWDVLSHFSPAEGEASASAKARTLVQGVLGESWE